MLYSIGKDSTVMLHLAMKAFYPAKPPFPLMHIDTTWKFRDMITFRDETVERLGVELIIYTNEEAARRASTRSSTARRLHTGDEDDRAEAGADRRWLRCGVRRRAARRGEIACQGARVLLPHRGHDWDPKNQRPEFWHLYNAA